MTSEQLIRHGTIRAGAWLLSTVWCLESTDLWSNFSVRLALHTNTHYPWHSWSGCAVPSDVPSILAGGVKNVHCRKWSKNLIDIYIYILFFFHDEYLGLGAQPSGLGRNKPSKRYERKNKSVRLWYDVCCHLLLGSQSCTSTYPVYSLTTFWAIRESMNSFLTKVTCLCFIFEHWTML